MKTKILLFLLIASCSRALSAQCDIDTITFKILGCDRYFWPESMQWYTQSGTFFYQEFPCTNVSRLDLQIANTVDVTDTVISCNSYTWYRNNQTYSASGTYTFVTNKVSLDQSFVGVCHDTFTLKLTVNTIPATISITGKSSLCAADSFYAFNSSVTGGLWSSTNPRVLKIDPVTGVASTVSRGLCTINYAITNSCGTTIGTKNIVVESPILTGVINGPSIVCKNSSFTLTYSGSPMGAWISQSPATATIDPSSGLVTTLQTADSVIFIYRIVTNACLPWDTVISRKKIVIINNAGTISGPSSVCLGMNQTYSSSIPVAWGTGQWSSSNVAVATINSSGVLKSISPGRTVVQYSISGCANATKTVTVINDVTPPILHCPSNVTVNLPLFNCSKSIITPNPTYSDNCNIAVLTWTMTHSYSNIVTVSPTIGINLAGTRLLKVGVTTIQYTAKDLAGLSTSCLYTITLKNPLCPAAPLLPQNEILEQRTNQENFSVVVFPNPSRKEFSVQIKSNETKKANISTINSVGQLVSKNFTTTNQQTLIGSDWPVGIYFLKVDIEGEHKIIKLIKGD